MRNFWVHTAVVSGTLALLVSMAGMVSRSHTGQQAQVIATGVTVRAVGAPDTVVVADASYRVDSAEYVANPIDLSIATNTEQATTTMSATVSLPPELLAVPSGLREVTPPTPPVTTDPVDGTRERVVTIGLLTLLLLGAGIPMWLGRHHTHDDETRPVPY